MLNNKKKTKTPLEILVNNQKNKPPSKILVNNQNTKLTKDIKNMSIDNNIKIDNYIMTKNLILYSYSKFSKSPQIKTQNFYYFLQKGLIASKNNIYYFIISGHEIERELEEELERKQTEINSKFPNTFNIVKRDNIGFDFGAYSDIILKVDYKSYDYFFCINDSVRGPFLPHWSPEQNWISIFSSLFDKDVKLVGPTLNYYRGRPHINSEFFVLDKIGLDIAIKKNIFSKNYITDFGQLCQNCEVGLSSNILDAGYNIKCLCEAYKGVDFRKHRGSSYNESTLMANLNRGGDPLYTNHYYDRNINIYEVIFIKANRNIDNYLVDKYGEWSLFGNKEYSNK